MKIYQLEYFIEVCKCQSISKAAENLFVSQPAVSFGIKELEDEFGVKLFERKGNKIALTDAADVLFDKVTVLLADIDDIRKEMLNMGKNPITIRVGTPPMIGTLLFPEVYNQLKVVHPKIKLEILEYGSLQSQSLVAENNADVAIAILDNMTSDILEVYELFKTELVFCVNASHPLASKAIVSWTEIENQDIILMKEDSYQNHIIKECFATNNIKPNILLYSSQLTTINNFILNSQAGAFIFKEIVDKDPRMRGLTLETPIHPTIGIMWKKNSRLYNDVKKFISFIKEYTSKL